MLLERRHRAVREGMVAFIQCPNNIGHLLICTLNIGMEMAFFGTNGNRRIGSIVFYGVLR